MASGVARPLWNPIERELHACDPVSGMGQALLAGRGRLAHSGESDRRLPPERGAEVFTEGLRRIENAVRNTGVVEIINVCLHKPVVKGHERVSLARLLNRINTSVASADRHAFLIFDEGRERMISQFYRRLGGRNHVPSRACPVLDTGGLFILRKMIAMTKCLSKWYRIGERLHHYVSGVDRVMKPWSS